jgi:hypothetical protein
MQTPLGIKKLSIYVRLNKAPSSNRRYLTQTGLLEIQGDRLFDSIYILTMNNAFTIGGYRSIVNHISRMLSIQMLTLQIPQPPW